MKSQEISGFAKLVTARFLPPSLGETQEASRDGGHVRIIGVAQGSSFKSRISLGIPRISTGIPKNCL